ncbi:MAG: AtpZ/AtpI family protein [Alphaproteobacteria bacterium]
MTEQKKSAHEQDIDARLRKARQAAEQSDAKSGPNGSRRSGLALAMRLGVEIVSSLVIGVGIGLLLDYWLDTNPWFMLLFFVLGAAAGLMNVYRVATGIGQGVGYRRDDGSNNSDGPAQ